MGTTNFLPFDPNAVNIQDDADYLASAFRLNGGAVDALVPSPTFNKVLYQTAGGVAALMQAMANKGFSPSDANYAALVSLLSNIITTADLRSNILNVAYSPTPIFNAANNTKFLFNMTGPVTGYSLINARIGDILTLCISNPGAALNFTPFAMGPNAYAFFNMGYSIYNSGPLFLNNTIPTAATFSVPGNSIAVQQFIALSEGAVPLGPMCNVGA
jgi:hypothetical protein